MAANPDTEPSVPGSRFLISDLCDLLDTYMSPTDVRDVYRAYLFGAEAHEGQTRLSGEPYIYHPVAVARVLAEMRMDSKSIIAAILHDVIEDTDTVKDQIESEFGSEVAELVDGVSKLTQISFESKAEAQAENFRKMILAMVKDIRVILVKLGDRLHNMRTLGVMRPDKRRRIARETLEIYVPIATRLGMNSMRIELEDLGFAALYPLRYRILSESIRKYGGNRNEILEKIHHAIADQLEQEKVECKIVSREKHPYSLYRKMLTKGVSFSDVFDVFAFRLIVASFDDCYRTLGVVHNLYKPIPGRFKDYIAIPKSNGYQSLHTVLVGPYGVPIEVQIRTQDMDRVAEAGVAAHWLYKSGDQSGNRAQIHAREWLRELLEMQKYAGNSLEFLENVKIDLFPDEVYVFTPKGDIMVLPRGSTAVDFAYAVHTDIGNTCIAAKINRKLVPLRTPLLNGQSVEVVTAPGARPNAAWLNFVVTGKARTSIRHHLKNLRGEEAINLGRRLLERALATQHVKLKEIEPERIQSLLEECGLPDIDALLEEIGLGNRVALLVARRLVPGAEGMADVPSLSTTGENARGLVIRGTEGMVINFARCCHPIPGDPIIGYISSGRGLVIHTEQCNNLPDAKGHAEKWIDVQWAHDVTGEFPVEVRVDVANQRGVLATVAAAMSGCGSNIENVGFEDRDGLTSSLTFTISVQDRRHLARVMRRVRVLEPVMRIARI